MVDGWLLDIESDGKEGCGDGFFYCFGIVIRYYNYNFSFFFCELSKRPPKVIFDEFIELEVIYIVCLFLAFNLHVIFMVFVGFIILFDIDG